MGADIWMSQWMSGKIDVLNNWHNPLGYILIYIGIAIAAALLMFIR